MGVLISGSGTNLQAIMDACADGRLDGEVVVVISSHAEAYGLERARKAGVPAVYLDRTSFSTFGAYNKAVLDALESHGADLVVMAGYMRLLGKDVLKAYPYRVLNIHPGPLPEFGGQGMYMDRFVTTNQAGVLILHGYGNVFERTLKAGESILVEPGAFLYKDASVQMNVETQSLTTGFFGGVGMNLVCMTGPGRVGIQSMYVHHNTE